MLSDELPLSESHAAEQTALKALFAKSTLIIVQSPPPHPQALYLCHLVKQTVGKVLGIEPGWEEWVVIVTVL